MAGGFESSGFKSSNFKRTFTVEKRDDGAAVISYTFRSQGRMLFSIVFIMIFSVIGIAAITPGPGSDPSIGWTLIFAAIALAIFGFKPIRKNLVVHQEGLEFLGKKLAFKDISATGIMSSGGGTSVYSVNGNIQSNTSQKTFAPYATAFGQDILLTKQLNDDAQASGMLEVVRQAMSGQTIQTQEQTSSSGPSQTLSLDPSKIINWLLTSKVAKWILIIIVVKWVLAVLNIF